MITRVLGVFFIIKSPQPMSGGCEDYLSFFIFNAKDTVNGIILYSQFAVLYLFIFHIQPVGQFRLFRIPRDIADPDGILGDRLDDKMAFRVGGDISETLGLDSQTHGYEQ